MNTLEKNKTSEISLVYPLRTPEDEKHQLFSTSKNNLAKINHFMYQGKNNFSNYNILIVEGCTGDEAIYMAEQLRDKGASITCLGKECESTQIAKERSKVRKLDNIKWVDSLGEESFDFIDCSYFSLIKPPEEKIKLFAKHLKKDGVIAMRVNAPHGRWQAYAMQEIMNIINEEETDIHEMIKNCKEVIENAVDGLWVKTLPANYPEIEEIGDSAIKHLFLPAQDKPYTVDDLSNLLKKTNLEINHFIPEPSRKGQGTYQPKSYVTDKDILEITDQMDFIESQATAELLHGDISEHIVYASFGKKEQIDYLNPDLIPTIDIGLGESSEDAHKSFLSMAQTNLNNLNKTIKIVLSNPKRGVIFRSTPNVMKIIELMDGDRTVKEIFNIIITETSNNLSKDELSEEFLSLCKALNIHCWILFRDKKVNNFPNDFELQNRMD